MPEGGKSFWCGIYVLSVSEQVLVLLMMCLDLLLVFFKVMSKSVPLVQRCQTSEFLRHL